MLVRLVSEGAIDLSGFGRGEVVTLHSANRVMSQESAIDKGTYLTGPPEKWRERMIPSC